MSSSSSSDGCSLPGVVVRPATLAQIEERACPVLVFEPATTLEYHTLHYTTPIGRSSPYANVPRIISLPFEVGREMRTVPVNTAIMLSPGSPKWKM